MMAVIGEVALLFVAAFFFCGGCAGAWVGFGFTGKITSFLMLIWSILGIALGLAAIQNGPIRIEIHSAQIGEARS